MKINPYIFRGYDIRGIAGKDLDPEIVEHLGKAYGTFLSRRSINRTIVGHDCRLTSDSYSEAIIKGLLNAGIDVIDIGLALAGNVYWAQYHFKAPGCVLVSASHNPAEYNGFKLGTGYSQTLAGDEIQELRQISDGGDFIKGKGELRKVDIKDAYFEYLLKKFMIPFNFKVAIDPGNSTPGAFAPELLEQAGCQVLCANCELDGNFPLGTPDPTQQSVAERVAKKVLAEKADIGFSFDADGDRIGVVDEKGGILWNDILVALFAADVLAENPGAKIVFNTLCSKVVEDTIKEKGGLPIMWRTGHSFIKQKAQNERAAFAGELSGHFFFLDKFYPHDDGLYSALRLLNYLKQTGQTLSSAIEKLPKYISSAEIKVGCADELKVALMEKIAKKLRVDFPNAQIIDDERAGDGVRLQMPDSMFVIRYSQNGPYLTVKFEAKTDERYNQLKKYISDLLYSYSEIDWTFGVNIDSLK
jgi:phosphomannomutase/phosphoglucomutase